ncbi:MAG TPA: DNA repair protein RecO [Pseudogracilibacillus sp.]|nr:DNA repair protein RecO [Pseudogracilibacillus sp.]
MLQKTTGIVLRTQDYRETHKLVTIFTKDFGKLTAISQGANKPRSRLSAVSQLFTYAQFLLYIPKGLATLRQGEVLSTYRNIRQDLTRTSYAAYIIELTDKLLEERKAEPILFYQLEQTLNWINEEDDYLIPIMMYEMKLFQYGGFAPVVDRCVNCNHKEPLYSFSIQEGGALCRRCSPIDQYATILQPALFRILTIFQQVPLERVGNINVKEENINLLRKLFDSYYERYGGYRLKTKKFLNSLNELDL